MLLTAVIALCVSHLYLSKHNSRLQSELMQLRSQLGLLNVDDDSKIHATAIPTYGPRQWRWRVHIPTDGEYAVHYAVGSSIPQNGLPATSEVATPFRDKQNKPLSNGEPVVLSFAITQLGNGRWAAVVGTSSGHPTKYFLRNPPSWLNEPSFSGWSVNVYGKDKTIDAAKQSPLMLLSYRKGKQVAPSPTAPGGGTTVETQPTDGIVLWIERIGDQ